MPNRRWHHFAGAFFLSDRPSGTVAGGCREAPSGGGVFRSFPPMPDREVGAQSCEVPQTVFNLLRAGASCARTKRKAAPELI
jgi:hypothetical protein